MMRIMVLSCRDEGDNGYDYGDDSNDCLEAAVFVDISWL